VPQSNHQTHNPIRTPNCGVQQSTTRLMTISSLLSPSLENIMQAHSRNHPKPSTAGSITSINHQPYENDTLQRTETVHLYIELWNKPEGILLVPLALDKTTLMPNSYFLTSEGMWTLTPRHNDKQLTELAKRSTYHTATPNKKTGNWR